MQGNFKSFYTKTLVQTGGGGSDGGHVWKKSRVTNVAKCLYKNDIANFVHSEQYHLKRILPKDSLRFLYTNNWSLELVKYSHRLH